MMAGKDKPNLALPHSIKIVDIVNQRKQGNPDLDGLNARERLKQAALQQTREALHKPSPRAIDGQITDPFMEVDDSWAVLPVTSIRFYENNPRKASNEAYAELKESIRINGILQPITVTKRPGEANYILFAGGNTRLMAIQELWEETRDKKFQETRVIIKQWRGEAAVLLAHMAENTQRNDMTFWDKANGIWAIKDQLEIDLVKELDFRGLEAELKKGGISISLQSISAFRFATEHLSEIGPWLSGLTVRNLQPYVNFLIKVSNLYGNMSEDIFYQSILNPVCKEYAETLINYPSVNEDLENTTKSSFSLETLIGLINLRLANALQISSESLRKLLAYLNRFPKASQEDLHNLVNLSQASRPQKASSGHADNKDGGGLDNPKEIHTQSPETIEATQEEITESDHTEFEYQHAESLEIETALDTLQIDATEDALGTQSDLVKRIHQLIALAGLSNCLIKAAEMPLGFYVGFPKDGPLDFREDAKNRQAAWWVVAMASGQFDRDLCRQNLSDRDAWRPLVLEEITENSHSLGELELEIQNNIGSEGELLPIPWLLNPENPVAGLCLEILILMRTSVRKGGAL